MARTTKQLTELEITRAKPRDKDYLLVDGKGLFLRVKRNGSKLWRFNYYKPFTQPKKRTEMSLGGYPDLSLAQARALREEYRALLARNIDPQEHREQEKRAKTNELTLTFRAMAKSWYEDRKQKSDFSERTARDTWHMLERHALPTLGDYPITYLTAVIAINALQPLAHEGKLITLHKLIGKINEIMRYALHRGLIPYNPLAEIYKEFDRPPESKGMATIDIDNLQIFLEQLFKARDKGRFSISAFYAVMIILLTGARPTEGAGAKWEDVDFNSKIWAYRVQKGNKNLPDGRLHRVTLSRQAISILHKARAYNELMRLDDSRFIFPSRNSKQGFITIETVRKAIIKSLDNVDEMTTHGIRHLISTSLNERNYNSDWIEKALSHKIKGKIRRTYNKAEYLEQRAKMLQEWADYIEGLCPESI